MAALTVGEEARVDQMIAALKLGRKLKRAPPSEGRRYLHVAWAIVEAVRIVKTRRDLILARAARSIAPRATRRARCEPLHTAQFSCSGCAGVERCEFEV